MIDEFHMWLIGTGWTLALFAVLLILKTINKTDKKLDSLKICNDNAHRDIHRKLESVVSGLRDKIEELWKHKR